MVNFTAVIFLQNRNLPQISAAQLLNRIKQTLFTLRDVAYNTTNLGAPHTQHHVRTRQCANFTPIEDGMSKNNSEADVAFIQALAELLNKNDLTELSVKREYGEDDRMDVRVVKQANVVTTTVAAPMQMTVASAAPAAAAAVVTEDTAQHPGAVTSPMVGTVYLSAEPGAAPFGTVGSSVTEGQTVLIIEAMKTMNHIPAPRAGTVKRIVVADGNAVEYGAPLMIIE